VKYQYYERLSDINDIIDDLNKLAENNQHDSSFEIVSVVTWTSPFLKLPQAKIVYRKMMT
jgi:hypothetical protein